MALQAAIISMVVILGATGTGKSKLGAPTEVRVSLSAPRWAARGGAATLRCAHGVPRALLYKLEFVRAGRKLLQFVRERRPPFVHYPVPGANINMSLTTENSITLQNLDFPASGYYWCEVSLETPIYTAASKGQEITIVYPQKHPPRITFGGSVVMAGDVIRANCTSAPAHPAPHLTWFVDGVKADERMTRDLTYQVPMSYRSAGRRRRPRAVDATAATPAPAPGCSLRDNTTVEEPVRRKDPPVVVPPRLTVAMSELSVPARSRTELACLATIPGFLGPGDQYADVKRQTVTVAVYMIDELAPYSPDLTAGVSTAKESARHLNTVMIILLSVSTALLSSQLFYANDQHSYRTEVVRS